MNGTGTVVGRGNRKENNSEDYGPSSREYRIMVETMLGLKDLDLTCEISGRYNEEYNRLMERVEAGI